MEVFPVSEIIQSRHPRFSCTSVKKRRTVSAKSSTFQSFLGAFSRLLDFGKHDELKEWWKSNTPQLPSYVGSLMKNRSFGLT